jgi:biopolymer transport protein ExbB
VQRGDLVSARNLSRMSTAPAAQVADAILQVADADPSRMQAAAEDAATLALQPLSRRLPHLNVLSNVATLLGLLGTISGLITAFSAVGAADPAQRSAFMAAGISTALNATAFGLIIAIPTLLIQGFLVGMVESVAEQVDEMTIRLSHAMSARAAGHGAGPVLPMKAASGAPTMAPRAGQVAPGGAK